MAKALDYDSLNENVKKTTYAVRGELYLRASELQKEGKKVFSFNFPYFQLLNPLTWLPIAMQIVFTNVGNPHALGQKPLTFPRQVSIHPLLPAILLFILPFAFPLIPPQQVVALCQAPFLLDDPNVGLLFPADAIARAKHYLSLTSGGLGAYSDSRGLPGVRKEVAEFIQRRDGYPT